MSKIKKITIITLTYNNCQYLESAIKSVKQQILHREYELEYLIVDDGSEYFSLEYVEKLIESALFTCKIIVNPSNIGTVKSFNQAIKMSSGDIIIPLSADDEFYYSSTVNDIAIEFEKTNDYIITGLRVPVLNGVEQPCLPLDNERKFFNNTHKLFKRIAVDGNIISGACTYYRRSLFDEVGFFDESYRLVEDYPFYLKVLKRGYKIILHNRKVIKYGTDGVSAAGKLSEAVSDDFLKCAKFILSLDEINFFEKRHIYFSRVLTRSDRRCIVSILKYPDQILISFLKKSINFLI